MRGLSGQVKLAPGEAPRLALNGEIFRGKLFARGEAQQDSEGSIKPSAVISIVNLDIPAVINTFPALAKSVKRPSGKITARAVISDALNIDGRVTSDRLSANGITIGTAELDGLSLNLGKGKISASGGANINTERFSFRTDVENFTPSVIPELKDVKGTYNLTAQGNGNYTDINSITVESNITAKNVGYSDYAIGSVNIPVDFAKGIVRISNGVVSLPKGKITLNGNVNINASKFDFTANAQNVEPRYIKGLRDLAGTYEHYPRECRPQSPKCRLCRLYVRQC